MIYKGDKQTILCYSHTKSTCFSVTTGSSDYHHSNPIHWAAVAIVATCSSKSKSCNIKIQFRHVVM